MCLLAHLACQENAAAGQSVECMAIDEKHRMENLLMPIGPDVQWPKTLMLVQQRARDGVWGLGLGRASNMR
jgi:hypothetical protein